MANLRAFVSVPLQWVWQWAIPSVHRIPSEVSPRSVSAFRQRYQWQELKSSHALKRNVEKLPLTRFEISCCNWDPRELQACAVSILCSADANDGRLPRLCRWSTVRFNMGKWLSGGLVLAGDGCRQSRNYKRGAYMEKPLEAEDIHRQCLPVVVHILKRNQQSNGCFLVCFAK